MPLYKYVKAFVVPPGTYISLFIFFAIYLWIVYLLAKHNSPQKSVSRGVKIALFSGMFFCLLCSFISYVSCINAGSQRLLHYLEYKYENKSVKPDAIIVLGSSQARTRAAINLYKKHKVDMIPSGYNGEAERMAKLMLNSKVAPEHIIVEPKATNTKDHVKYILPIARAKGYKRVYMVTSAYHMPRSMMNFKRPFAAKGIEVVPFCCEYRTPKEHRRVANEWVPDIRYFDRSALAWHEYLGMLELWLF